MFIEKLLSSTLIIQVPFDELQGQLGCGSSPSNRRTLDMEF